MLLPDRPDGHPSGLVFGGKAGIAYVINPQRMGGWQRNPSSRMQKVRIANGIYSAPAYWNGHLYYYGSEATLQDFAVQGGRISATPLHRSSSRSPFSGGTPTISANGNTNSVVWLVETRAWDRGGTPAILKAFDALNVQRQLYSSDQNAARDHAGEAVRFVILTVMNGRVYVGVKNAVEVYGLLPNH